MVGFGGSMFSAGIPPMMADRPIALDERTLRQAFDYIRRRFHRRPTLSEIAAVCRVSPFHFHRVFARRYGETPFEMVCRLQIDRAKELLLEGVPLAEVAARCGFCSQSHFGSRFKSVTGTPPARWLRQNGRPVLRRARAAARELLF